MRLPIAEHNDKLKAIIDELEKVPAAQQAVQEQKDVIYQTRIELATLERTQKEGAATSMKSLLDETARLEKAFKRLSEIEACSRR